MAGVGVERRYGPSVYLWAICTGNLSGVVTPFGYWHPEFRVLGSKSLFSGRFEMSAYRLTRLGPFACPRARGIPHLLTEGLLGRPVGVSGVCALDPNVSTNVGDASRELTVGVNGSATCVVRRMVVTLRRAPVMVSLARGGLLVDLKGSTLVPLALLVDPPLALSPVEGGNGRFRF